MSQVITLEGYTPTARFDAVPWTLARIDEAPTSSGSWTTIDTITLCPVDSDPSTPAVRNLTTDQASDTAGLWYRIVFIDGSAATSQPTDSVQNINPEVNVYASRDELKAALQLSSQTYADADIDRACAAASRAIDNRTGRIFYSTDETRYYTPFDAWDNAIDILDVQSITSFTVDVAGNSTYSQTWTAGTDYDLEPFNAPLRGFPYERARIRWNTGRRWPTYQKSIRVIGTFGWASIPDPVNQYALILASKLLDRARKSPNGVIVAGLEAPIAMRISRNDPDYELLLGGYDKSTPGL